MESELKYQSLFSQPDPRWGDIMLGTSGGQTIASAGCLLSVAAAMLCEFGARTDPGRLNRWLCRNNGYTHGNNIIFSALSRFAADRGIFVASDIVDCGNIPAPMGRVRDTLRGGGAVLAKVDFRPGGAVQQHWVRLLACDEADCLIHDPWLPPGTAAYSLMARYAHHTWNDPARVIFRLALYRVVDDERGRQDDGGHRAAPVECPAVQTELSPRAVGSGGAASGSYVITLPAWGPFDQIYKEET